MTPDQRGAGGGSGDTLHSQHPQQSAYSDPGARNSRMSEIIGFFSPEDIRDDVSEQSVDRKTVWPSDKMSKAAKDLQLMIGMDGSPMRMPARV